MKKVYEANGVFNAKADLLKSPTKMKQAGLTKR